MKMQVKDVVQKYLDETGLTLRGFADALTCGLTPDQDTSLTHVTIINWRNGRTEPDTDLLTLMLMQWHDWRFDFALECLAAKRPEIWGEDVGAVWEVAERLRMANLTEKIENQ